MADLSTLATKLGERWPVWHRDDVLLVCGECLDVLPLLDGGVATDIVSDVPYGVEYAGWDGAMPPQLVLDECLRVSSGQVMWFGAAPKVLEFGLYTPSPPRMLVWAPRFSLSNTGADGYLFRWHPIAVWRMSAQDVVSSDVLTDPCEGRHWWNHPATKPLTLMEKLVATCGNCVCDPYFGSGTTGVACIRSGKSFIGVEREKQYFDIAVKRCAAELDRYPLLEQKKPRQLELVGA